MVDAEAGVVFRVLAEVVPEGVDGFFGEEVTDGVSPALGEELLVAGASLGLEEGVFAPGAGVVDVEVGGDNVVIADEGDGFFGFGEGGGVGGPDAGGG